MIVLDSWEQLPDKLLYLHKEVRKRPRRYTLMQSHNSKLWDQVKDALARHLATAVCNASHWQTVSKSALS